MSYFLVLDSIVRIKNGYMSKSVFVKVRKSKHVIDMLFILYSYGFISFFSFIDLYFINVYLRYDNLGFFDFFSNFKIMTGLRRPYNVNNIYLNKYYTKSLVILNTIKGLSSNFDILNYNTNNLNNINIRNNLKSYIYRNYKKKNNELNFYSILKIYEDTYDFKYYLKFNDFFSNDLKFFDLDKKENMNNSIILFNNNDFIKNKKNSIYKYNNYIFEFKNKNFLDIIFLIFFNFFFFLKNIDRFSFVNYILNLLKNTKDKNNNDFNYSFINNFYKKDFLKNNRQEYSFMFFLHFLNFNDLLKFKKENFNKILNFNITNNYKMNSINKYFFIKQKSFTFNFLNINLYDSFIVDLFNCDLDLNEFYNKNIKYISNKLKKLDFFNNSNLIKKKIKYNFDFFLKKDIKFDFSTKLYSIFNKLIANNIYLYNYMTKIKKKKIFTFFFSYFSHNKKAIFENLNYKIINKTIFFNKFDYNYLSDLDYSIDYKLYTKWLFTRNYYLNKLNKIRIKSTYKLINKYYDLNFKNLNHNTKVKIKL